MDARRYLELLRSDGDALAAGDHRVAFWNRRMAQEAAVHRWDAENAVGDPGSIDAELAADGIDEFLGAFIPGDEIPYEGKAGTVHLHCTDVPGEWTVTLREGAVPTYESGHSEGDAAVRGSAEDLLLFVWRRLPADGVEVLGDGELVGDFWTTCGGPANNREGISPWRPEGLGTTISAGGGPMRAPAVAILAVLVGVAAVVVPPPAPTASNRTHSRLLALLDMESKSRVPTGVTPASRRLSPRDEAGGRALVYRAGGSLLNVPGAGSSLMHRTGFQAGEPTLGVTKGGSIFYQALDGPPTVLRSKDEGRTWKDVSPTILDNRKRHPQTLDPFLWVDYDTGRVFTYDFFFGCSELSWSDDDGKTWTTSVLNCGLQDHQNLFTGPPVFSPTVGYPNIVYACSNQAGATIYEVAAQCLKSIDGGITWAPTGAPAYVTDMQEENDLGIPGYCHGAVGHGYVGPDGTVYVPKGFCGQPFLAISHDEGATWERVQVADNGVPQTMIGVYEHETSVATDAKGNVYYFWMSYDRLPYLAVSRDQGKTWTKPIPVGPPGLKEATLPHLTVGGTGKVAVVYYGSTNSPGKPFPQNDDCKPKMVECFRNLFFLNPPDPKSYARTTWNGYMTVSGDALSKKPTFHTVTINDPDDPFVRGTCGPIRCKSVYDFIDVVIDKQGRPWAAYVDICLLSCTEGKSGNQGNEGVVGTIAGGPRLR